jgi:hypothetical protein
LLLPGPPEEIAAGHPLSRREFPKNNAIEMRLPIIQRQRAATALIEVRRRSPRNQSLVAQRRRTCHGRHDTPRHGNEGAPQENTSYPRINPAPPATLRKLLGILMPPRPKSRRIVELRDLVVWSQRLRCGLSVNAADTFAGLVRSIVEQPPNFGRGP